MAYPVTAVSSNSIARVRSLSDAPTPDAMPTARPVRAAVRTRPPTPTRISLSASAPLRARTHLSGACAAQGASTYEGSNSIIALLAVRTSSEVALCVHHRYSPAAWTPDVGADASSTPTRPSASSHCKVHQMAHRRQPCCELPAPEPPGARVRSRAGRLSSSSSSSGTGRIIAELGGSGLAKVARIRTIAAPALSERDQP